MQNQQKYSKRIYWYATIDSPLYISSHSKHFSKVFGKKSMGLNGEVKNNGTEIAQFVQVISTYYN